MNQNRKKELQAVYKKELIKKILHASKSNLETKQKNQEVNSNDINH